MKEVFKLTVMEQHFRTMLTIEAIMPQMKIYGENPTCEGVQKKIIWNIYNYIYKMFNMLLM